MVYEYTVIPAPSRGEKAKGAKTGIERFSVALAGALNEMAADGWEYVRAETLPAEERSGLTSRTTVYHNVLVFRRSLEPEQAAEPAVVAEYVAPAAPANLSVAEDELPEDSPLEAPDDAPVRAPFSQPMRAMPRPAQQARSSEPPLTAPEPAPQTGPRLGPAR
ncbi:DUF4177 domain-containing protein [Paracoccus aestuariivivens]|uniref:DUF4177 domain-containing protein n=1 Tax=Paracoccus aestuariivivens TaxID=1820333 RepID=A0A6L6JFJ6_9RHOB|nr:DUF4177 domain-containing protein [Paracoccus aestuariivivens]MTH78671.1 DUF4177 domain-containing protein [Paracoccus aestuariivivens]